MATGLGSNGQPVRHGQLLGESMAGLRVHAVGREGGWRVAASTYIHHTLMRRGRPMQLMTL